MRRKLLSFTVALAAGLTGCAGTLSNAPRNKPLAPGGQQLVHAPVAKPTTVALSFSGGGLRAAAFAYGVLEGLRDMPAAGTRSLLDEVDFVTSVSGGSLTAGYFGLHGVKGLSRFRAEALERDGEAAMRFSMLNPVNLTRLLAGGLNDRSNLQHWLEGQVFKGATMGDLVRQGRPIVWINATNAAHRIAFPFHERAFDAICSDFASFPLADAVAASMAVPVLFAPVVVQKFPEACASPLPPGLAPRPDDEQKRLRSALRHALNDFRNPASGPYVKLIDGGLTDNLGLVSILQSRILLNTAYGPINEADAIAARNLLFVVVDAGQGPSLGWGHQLTGPSALDVATAAADTAIESTMRMSYASFIPMVREWRDAMVRFRCELPEARQAEARARDPLWRCDGVQFTVTRMDFDDLGPETEARLSAIPTRLKLEPAQLDQLIEAGRRAVSQDATVRAFSKRLSETR
jgi:NTE family protein